MFSKFGMPALFITATLFSVSATARDAQAFDSSEWNWSVNINENVTSFITIESNLAPSGMVLIEETQEYIGDLSSISVVDNIRNTASDSIIKETSSREVFTGEYEKVFYSELDAFLSIGAGNYNGANPMGNAKYDGSGEFKFDKNDKLALYILKNYPSNIDISNSIVEEGAGKFEIYAYFEDLEIYMQVEGTYDCKESGGNCKPTGEVKLYSWNGVSSADKFATLISEAELNQKNGFDKVNPAPEGGGEVKLSADLSIQEFELRKIMETIVTEHEIYIPSVKNALTDLPEVFSSSNAVANNTSLDTDVMVELSEGQFTYQVSDGGSSFDPSEELSDNSNINKASALAFNAIIGNLLKSQINSVSTVSSVLNASVVSTATSVTNNFNVNLQANQPDDAILLADVVQFAFADVQASSEVIGVTLNAYTNLGRVQRPIISSSATAVGQNKSITVGLRL